MGKQWKQWDTLFSQAPKLLWMVIAAMKLRHLLLGEKAMTKLDSILKSRDFTLPARICIVKAMVFLVVMYGCESGTINKSTEELITFELWCWRRLLRVAWTAMKSNHSILNEINPEYCWCWSWSSNTVAIWWKKKRKKEKTVSFEKTIPDIGKDWGQEKRMTEDEKVGWHHQFNGCEFEQVLASKGIGDGQGSLVCYSPWGHKESETTEWLNNDNCFLNDDSPVW